MEVGRDRQTDRGLQREGERWREQTAQTRGGQCPESLACLALLSPGDTGSGAGPSGWQESAFSALAAG